jgi:3-hydroxyacyl-CoA dehydrogenase
MGCGIAMRLSQRRPGSYVGMIPGAGGTQRQPRLIGARAALDMILSGTSISSADAKVKGLVDEVTTVDLPEAALAFCHRLIDNGGRPRPTCNRAVRSDGFDENSMAEALRAHSRTLKGRSTQHLVIEALKASRLPGDFRKPEFASVCATR